MYRQSMANGVGASFFFFLFLYFLARHMRKLKMPSSNDCGVHQHHQHQKESCLRQLECGTLPPPYSVVPSQPPPTYQEALKMVEERSDSAASKF